MPSARFVMRFDRSIGRPLLPDGNVEGDGAAVFADGTPGYGWAACSPTPDQPSCIVFINSSQAIIDAMKAHDDYVWIEDVE